MNKQSICYKFTLLLFRNPDYPIEHDLFTYLYYYNAYLSKGTLNLCKTIIISR